MDKVDVRRDHGYYKVVAKTAIRLNEIVFDCYQSDFRSERTIRTLQIGSNKHIRHKLLDYVNHSCIPNSVFDTSEICFRAIKDIDLGEEITFFYPGAEFHLANKFYCNCAKPECLEYVQGGFEINPKIIMGAIEKGFCTNYFKNLFLDRMGGLHSTPSSNFNGDASLKLIDHYV